MEMLAEIVVKPLALTRLLIAIEAGYRPTSAKHTEQQLTSQRTEYCGAACVNHYA